MLYFTLFCLLVFILLPRKTFLWRLVRAFLYCIDCLCNAVLILGDPRETISSRVGKAMQRGVWWIPPVYYIINLLFVLVDGNWSHCDNAIDNNVGDQSIIRW